MDSKINPKLLRDIASLVARYGPEEFDDLARELETGQFRAQLVELLHQMAESSRQNKANRSARKSTSQRTERKHSSEGTRSGSGSRLKEWADVILSAKPRSN